MNKNISTHFPHLIDDTISQPDEPVLNISVEPWFQEHSNLIWKWQPLCWGLSRMNRTMLDISHNCNPHIFSSHIKGSHDWVLILSSWGVFYRLNSFSTREKSLSRPWLCHLEIISSAGKNSGKLVWKYSCFQKQVKFYDTVSTPPFSFKKKYTFTHPMERC